ncbi:ACP S-malonyltransferase [Mycolicibacterium mengxianglii]|uniref:ACP S-malonyltransferase n=1 Tax=Mycolicibacterium mengxianglii TaxID=2736649 RepID=UPI0018D04DBC|nr:acyltransferase domain-containing protein [Mycolicibacterium mengxianglii]
MSLAFLFPGQGAQRPDMLGTLPRSPATAEVLDESRTQLAQLGLRPDIDTASALEDTTNAQLALLIAGVASARALTAEHGLIPQFVAGHSVGAFPAAVCAGVLTLTEALTAVTLRGQLMERACRDGQWGMAAVSGLPTRTAADIAGQVGTAEDPIWLANINSATQTVFSGTVIGLRSAEDAARRAGARNYERLQVSVASHCPLQQDTARRMAEYLTGLPRRDPSARYLTNTRGRATGSAQTVLDDLAQAVARPVQWYDATRLMGELGVTCALEAIPGHTLTRLLTSAVPGIAAEALQDSGLAPAAAHMQHLLQRTPE